MRKYFSQHFSIDKGSIVFFIICCLLLACVSCSRASEKQEEIRQEGQQQIKNTKKAVAQNQSQEQQKLKAVLISLLKPCGCMADRCMKGNQASENIKKKYGDKFNFEFFYYDRREDRKQIMSIAKKYRFATLPVLLIFNEKDEKVGSVFYTLSEQAIEKELKRLGVI